MSLYGPVNALLYILSLISGNTNLLAASFKQEKKIQMEYKIWINMQ